MEIKVELLLGMILSRECFQSQSLQVSLLLPCLGLYLFLSEKVNCPVYLIILTCKSQVIIRNDMQNCFKC